MENVFEVKSICNLSFLVRDKISNYLFIFFFNLYFVNGLKKKQQTKT